MKAYTELRKRYISHKPWRLKINLPELHHFWTPDGNIALPITPPPAAEQARAYRTTP